jgi:hypothetical protein
MESMLTNDLSDESCCQSDQLQPGGKTRQKTR